ncbi:GNAT family N-acetyltransferase [Cohnella sp. GCM10020058]|uniref:GNAT family N-acetyltransferase n=1 Tax=Cohnella sp. GCM10020058 TaxID=3317330 RepID=UPI003630CFEA
MVLSLGSATERDADVIAEMNFQLIQDEGSQNPMNLFQLRERMLGWLRDGWNIDLFFKEEKRIGYAVYKLQVAPFDDIETEVYIRQFFINRDERSQGYGRDAINLLKKDRFGGATTMIIDVLETNPAGRRFWEKVGFKAYYTNMRKQLQ